MIFSDNSRLFFLVLAISFVVSGCSTNKPRNKPQFTPNGKELSLGRSQGDYRPLYIVNGEFITSRKRLDRFLNTAPSYFEEIKVIDPIDAILEYGEIGKYRIVKITLSDSTIRAKTTEITQKKDISVYGFDEDLEHPPQLQSAKRTFLEKIDYPKECLRAGVNGKVTVYFTVNKLGHTKKLRIKQGIGSGCDEEAIRVIKNAPFYPAVVKGKPVNAKDSLNIYFRSRKVEKIPSLNQR